MEPDFGPAREPVEGTASGAPAVNPRLLRRFRSIAAPAGADTAEVQLGRMLFFDPRLSRANDISCNTCHPLDRYGADGRRVSVGHLGRPGSRNTPTVFHTARQVAQFWDGRATDLVAQAGFPITDDSEMAMPGAAEVEARLRAIPGYRDAFQAAYPDDREPVTFEHVTTALAAFERGLVTPSRWDRFLDGEANALTTDEISGFLVFADVGCVECHTGPLVGGSMFQKAGRARPWPDPSDVGRAQVTGDEEDRLVFKVPSLRDVARTAPYFHDGSAATLHDAIVVMGRHQLDLELAPHQVEAIAVWLSALTGELPASYIAAPVLPADTR